MYDIKLGAVIVTYNPKIGRFKDLIYSILNQVDFIIIVDNRSKNITEIKEICSTKSNMEIIENDQNYGIGKALNIGIEKLKEHFDWVLTLDQDSVIETNIKSIIDEVIKLYEQEKIGIIFLNTKDLNKKEKYKEIIYPIISGSIVNSEVFNLGLAYREEFFLDDIDYDFDYKIRTYEFKIIETNFKAQDHILGNLVDSILNKKVNIEPDWRIYLMARNSFKLFIERKFRIKDLLNVFLRMYFSYVVSKPFKPQKKILKYLYIWIIGIKDAVKNNFGISENLKNLWE